MTNKPSNKNKSPAASSTSDAVQQPVCSADAAAINILTPHQRRFALTDVKAAPSVLTTIRRQFRVDDISFIHALVGLALATVGMLTETPTLKFWHWADEGGFFSSPTSAFQIATFAISISYFFYDTYWIFVKARARANHEGVNPGGLTFTLEDYGYLFHHFACVFGLGFPVLYKVDGPIGIVAYFIGEASNPPRAVAEFISWELAEMRATIAKAGKAGLAKAGVTLEQCTKTYSYLYNMQEMMAQAHFASFIVCRLYLVKFVFSYMLPMCELWTSKAAAIMVLLFSLASVIFIFNARKVAMKEHVEVHMSPFARIAAAAATATTGAGNVDSDAIYNNSEREIASHSQTQAHAPAKGKKSNKLD